MTIIAAGSIFAVIVLSVIVLYILRTAFFGIPVFPLCPVKPTNKGMKDFSPGNAVTIQSNRTESDGLQLAPQSKLEPITYVPNSSNFENN